MSHHLVQPLYRLALDSSLNAEGSSSSSNKMPVDLKRNDDFDEDELVWLGGIYDPLPMPRTEVQDQTKDIWCQDEWDCPTDILYHHAESEDHIKHVQTKETQLVEQVLQPIQHPHPMFDHPICFASSVRERKTIHDPSTWDSPTDILYSHADFDQPETSALGIQLNVQGEDITTTSLRHAMSSANAETQIIRHNQYGVPREPYNAATWDSPTDILYAHGSSDEEEGYCSRARRESGEVSSPVTPYSAFVSTPIDDSSSLPTVPADSVEFGGQAKHSKCVDELVAEANIRLVSATSIL